MRFIATLPPSGVSIDPGFACGRHKPIRIKELFLVPLQPASVADVYRAFSEIYQRSLEPWQEAWAKDFPSKGMPSSSAQSMRMAASLTAEGEICYELKNPWKDGTTAVVFSKQEFIEKLASLVPYPHKNLVIYSGCLAPNHRIRSQIIPASASSEALSDSATSVEERRRAYIPWAELLKRTWGVDIFMCRHCGSPTRILAFIADPTSLSKIIASCGLLPRPAPRRKVSMELGYDYLEGESA